ncbi:hypothetical protein SDC9_79124 [bioreactor metagenome]|uniref:Uncharacterized protein n=1 Tax=bioreactor metagenome TaxID=1076179 RepID=A0A644YVC3_9ZZZZ
MLAGDDAAHVGGVVEVAVVVVVGVRVDQAAGAADLQAGGAVELVDGLGGAGVLGVADRAAQPVLLVLEIGQVEPVHEHPVDGDGVDRGGRLRGGGGEDTGIGEPAEQGLAEPGAQLRGDAEGLLRPAGVPALRGRDRIEQLVALELGAADAREGGGGSTLGEGGHALAARAAAPDLPAVAVVLDVGLEPLVGDRALGAHVLQDAADPPDQHRIGALIERGEQARLAVGLFDHLPGDVRQRGGQPGVDLGGHRSGELEGAAEPRLQAELQHGVEEQPAACAPRRARLRRPGGIGVPERGEVGPVDHIGRQQPITAESVLPGLGEDGGDDGVEVDRLVPDAGAQRGAQRQGVGAGLDEPGPVRRVLDAVGEDQRLLLGGVEVVGAEQARQRHRELGGDGRAEEADAVVLEAGGAGVLTGQVVGVLSPVGEDRQVVAVLRLFAALIGRSQGQLAAANVEPAELAVADRIGGQMIRLGRGGLDQRPEAAAAGGVVGADPLVVVGECGARGPETDPPAGPAAVAAVDGGERDGARVSGEAAGTTGDHAVVGPPVAEIGLGHPVDPGEFAHPQVGLHRDEPASQLGAQVAQCADQVGEELGRRRDPVAADAGQRQQLSGEGLQADCVVAVVDEGAHQRVGLGEGLEVLDGGQRRPLGLHGGVVGTVETVEHGDREVVRLGGLPEVRDGAVDHPQQAELHRRGGETERGDSGLGPGAPLVEGVAGLGYHVVGGEGLAEHGGGEADHLRGVALVAEGGGGRDRGDPAQRPGELLRRVAAGGPVALQRQPEAAQQHGDVGALGAVVGVELVEHQVGQALGALPPDVLVLLAQEELVEHLVVGQQDVRRSVLDDAVVGDQPLVADLGPLRAFLTGVERGGDAGQAVRRIGDQLGETERLVVGQRIHRVEDQRLGAGDAPVVGPQHVVEDRVEERLGLARPGAGGDQGRQWPGLVRPEVEGGQPRPGRRLMGVRRVGRLPLQRRCGVPGRRPVRQTHPYVGALEDAVALVGEEIVEGAAGIGVGEGERRGEVVPQAPLEVPGLDSGQQLTHERSASRRSNSAYAVRMSVSRSRTRNGSS